MDNFKLPILFIYIRTLLFCTSASAQTNDMALQEDRFVKLYSKLLQSSQGGHTKSTTFSEEFTAFIKANPVTINHPFNKLIDSNYCYIKTSADGNFRVYSWDTWGGGTMHFFRGLYQWKSNGKVFTKTPKQEEGDAGSFCSKIFTVTAAGNTYYLALTNGIYSNKDASQSVAVYTVTADKLIDTVKLFKTKTKHLNRIDVSFDFFSVVDRPERPLELITYDERLGILYVPVVNGKEQVTARNILYQLKGGFFQFIGIETGKRK